MSIADTRELLLQLARVSVCQISDACPSLPVETEIRPLDLSFRVCAPAFTVLCPADDNLTLHHALHVAEPGLVLVVAGSGGKGAAFWGEIMSISAQARGLSGTLVDGPARDPLEIAALRYPVFARSIFPRRANKREYGSIGEPIRWGNLTINQGDIVVADCNGVLTFPDNQLPRVLEQALAVVRKEEELKDAMRKGKSFFDLASLSSLIPPTRNRV
ncbi:MAG TPA: RraA family protein [Candidatus Dormibacteraeota bacterium]|nr:RraA family protein [Candidatus Dormibacteraeota bacterium]